MSTRAPAHAKQEKAIFDQRALPRLMAIEPAEREHALQFDRLAAAVRAFYVRTWEDWCRTI